MNLYEIQRQLEEEATAAGYRRFEKRLRNAEEAGRASEEGAGKKLVREALLAMTLGIGKVCADAEGQKQCKIMVKWCNALGHDVAAYLTIKAVLDMVLHSDSRRKQPMLLSVTQTITRLLRDQVRMMIFKEQEPALYNYKMNRFDTGNYAHRLRSLRATMKWAGVQDHELLTPGHAAHLGVQLLDVMIQTTGLVDYTTQHNLKKYRSSKAGKVRNREIIVRPTAKTLDWVTSRNNHMSLLEPIYKPMVIIPVPWAPSRPGGYWFQQTGQIPLVRGREHRHMSKIYEEIDMPEVYAALNAVQETAWRINGPVLDVVQTIRDEHRTRGGVKVLDLEALPPKPPNIKEDKEALRGWKYQAKLVHDRNAAHKAKVIEQSRCIITAQGMAEYEEIFFPHSLDFRGRLYPAVPYLNPQGDDLARGLLTFAHGKPLGKSGVRFLAVHGANCMAEWGGVKLDKATIEERVNWVFNHSGDIAACADDPFANKMWEEADKPLQFLAFAFEWGGYLEHGDDFVSHLPVAQDGTCNGLQHYAALIKDGALAQHVNLMDGARPVDIYQVVADAVEEKLHDACHAGEDRACEWLMSGLVDRKLIKRPVMTYPYGTNVYGITDTLRDELPSTPEAPNLKKMYRYLAQTIWNTMVDTVKGAHRVMQFLQETARVQLKKENAPLVWVTPLGFPVVQTYSNYTHRQINTELAGCAIYPSVYFESPGVMKHRHVNGIAPNFVHSLDATALMMTVNAAVKAGITEFGMVHDSYATLAADAGALADHIRVQFHRLYAEHDPLASFYWDMASQYGLTPQLAEYKLRGDWWKFNMDLVLKSRYFFH